MGKQTTKLCWSTERLKVCNTHRSHKQY